MGVTWIIDAALAGAPISSDRIWQTSAWRSSSMSATRASRAPRSAGGVFRQTPDANESRARLIISSRSSVVVSATRPTTWLVAGEVTSRTPVVMGSVQRVPEKSLSWTTTTGDLRAVGYKSGGNRPVNRE